MGTSPGQSARSTQLNLRREEARKKNGTSQISKKCQEVPRSARPIRDRLGTRIRQAVRGTNRGIDRSRGGDLLKLGGENMRDGFFHPQTPIWVEEQR